MRSLTRCSPHSWRTCFNPHPARWPGAIFDAYGPAASTTVFQSSPSTLAGCDRPPLRPDPHQARSFNPHPARWPGAMSNCTRRITQWQIVVSILTQHAGRVRFGGSGISVTPAYTFQSSPSTLAGCDQRARQRPGVGCHGFNPHPARWPGAIVRQPRGTAGLASFNPHPARWPGAIRHVGPNCTPPRRFNPHPARWPGAIPGGPGAACAGYGFNPHPARWPGAIAQRSLSAPLIRVSILTQHAGRVRCQAKSALRYAQRRFNPHPARWPGAMASEWSKHSPFRQYLRQKWG